MHIQTITESTKVTYPQRATEGKGSILVLESYPKDENKIMIITDSTPFHPADHNWPDQPCDRGVISIDEYEMEVIDCITAALHLEKKEYYFDKEIPVKRGEKNWIFAVVHLIKKDESLLKQEFIGKEATLQVDKDYRRLLSASHSACHLTAFAFDKTTKDFWKKEVKQDSLGNPNIDQIAMQKSFMTISGSHDQYRFGKSLKKKGFEVAEFFENVKEVEEQMNKQIQAWLQSGAEIDIEASSPSLESVRFWECKLPEGIARIPCGGTHLSNLDEFASITVSFEKIESEPEIVVRTKPVLREK